MASVKPIVVPSTANLVYTNQGVVTAFVGPGGNPTTLGLGAPNFIAPAIIVPVFNARGRGRFSLFEFVPPTDVRFDRGPRIAGQQGSLDLWVDMGAAGGALDICTVADTSEPTTLVGSIVVGTSATTNRPLISIADVDGTVVGAVTPSAGSFADGERVHIRMTWDSANPVPGGTGGRHATLSVNGEQVPPADWSTDPVAPWTPFVPDTLLLGFGTGTEFNGTVLAFQASNTVSA